MDHTGSIKRLIIVGNGFDMSHGLKTRYDDFKDFLEKSSEYPNHVEKIECSIPIGKEKLWSEFEISLSKLDEDEIIDEAEDICSALLYGYSHPNWRDSMNHSYQIEVENHLKFLTDLKYYMNNWILSINACVGNKYGEIINEKIDKTLFISFNYTDTLEKRYLIEKNKILYIHGKAEPKSHVIVGHGNKSLGQEYKPRLTMDHYGNIECEDDVRYIEGRDIIKWSLQDTIKDSTNLMEYNATFFSKFSGVQEVIIIGHSLGNVDLDYFKHIKEITDNNNTNSQVKWIATYYGDEQNKERLKGILTNMGIYDENISIVPVDDLINYSN